MKHQKKNKTHRHTHTHPPTQIKEENPFHWTECVENNKNKDCKMLSYNVWNEMNFLFVEFVYKNICLGTTSKERSAIFY